MFLRVAHRRHLRVLMTADAVGGVWSYVLDLAEGLAAHGVQTTLAVLGPAPSGDQLASARAVPRLQLIETGWPLDWTARQPGEVEAAGMEIAALAVACDVDLIHLNSPALAATGRMPVPAIGVCHSCVATWWEAAATGPLPDDLAWRRDLTARGYGFVDALVAPSAAFAAATARVYARKAPPSVVHNGRYDRTATLPTASSPLFAFTAGRLWDRGKNVAVLDEAAARLTIPILAAGPQTAPHGERIQLNAVQAIGSLTEREIRLYLGRQPIFVSPARYEPFGLAVLEAAQAGCPLVLSDIPTFRELWDGAATFVPANDRDAIASAIETLAADPERRNRLGVAARRRAQRYSVAAMTDGIMAVYRAVLPNTATGSAETAA